MFYYKNKKPMKQNNKNLYDEYYTKPEVAKHCYDLFLQTIQEVEPNYFNKDNDVLYLDPCAGSGVFFNLMPKDRRIGLDLNKQENEDIRQLDYLNYELPKNKHLIICSNPPFGSKGVIAMQFLAHSINADFVGFILPMIFNSNGKSSLKYQVKSHHLLKSIILPKNAFYNPKNHKEVSIQCCFQIWSKKTYKESGQNRVNEFNFYHTKINPYEKYVSLFTCSLAKNRECGRQYIDKADFYVATSFFTNNKIVFKFSDVKYKSGLAFVFNKTLDEKIKQELLQYFMQLDWTKYSNLSTNGCYHITKGNVYESIKDWEEKKKIEV